MFRAPYPAHLPTFNQMCEDLRLPLDKIARYLGVSVRTIKRWKKQDAPRAATLALYWESSYGISAMEAQRGNLIACYDALAQMRAREIERLKKIILMLEAQRFDEAANAPIINLPLPSSAGPDDSLLESVSRG